MKKKPFLATSKKPNQNCFTCQWRERSQWCVLEADEINFISESKVTQSYQAGQVAFNQGDAVSGVYCVVAGTVALRRTDTQGNTMLVRLCHPGDSIGYRDFFANSDFTVSAEVLSEATLCHIPRSAFEKMLSTSPTLSSELTRRLAVDGDRAEESLLQANVLSVRTRVAHLLLALKDRYGVVTDDGTLRITLPLSRQDMADLLGSRPETIARVINALETDDVARFSGRNVIIPDLDPLLDEIEPQD